MAKDDVASALVIDGIANLGKGFDDFPTGANRQFAHAGIRTSTTVSWMEGGIGSLCFFRLSR